MTRRKYEISATLILEVDDEGVQKVTVQPWTPLSPLALQDQPRSVEYIDLNHIDSSDWPALRVELPETIAWEG